MKSETCARTKKGSMAVNSLVAVILVGLVMLFVGIFILASVETIFEGIVTECSNSNAAGSPEIAINGTANESALQNYTITASLTGVCNLSTSLENTSAVTGSVYVYSYPGGSLLQTIANPVTGATATNGLTVSAGTYAVNYTFIGSGDVNVTTDSYVRCCTSMVNRQTPAGQTYDNAVTTTGVVFTLLGIVLILIGLVSAIGALKNMT